jgi:hypothetical protein
MAAVHASPSSAWRGHSRPPVSVTARAIAASLLIAFAALFSTVSASLADALDGVPLDMRARLAVAASAYPPDEAPHLHPAAADFTPDAAPDYLETDGRDQFGASTGRNNYLVHFTILGFADGKAAAAALEGWKQQGNATEPLPWGGGFAAFRRGAGLLGMGLAGAGVTARGQSGPWHFEIQVTPQPRNSGDDLGAAVAAMKTLAANAKLYRLFPRRLVVSFEVAGRVTELSAGMPFRVPLLPDEEVPAVFALQVLDEGKPVSPVDYKLELSGPLAAVAELDRDGERVRTGLAETSSGDGEPARITFVFPPAVSEELSAILDAEEASTMRLRVEARINP